MKYKYNDILIQDDYAILICKSATFGTFKSKIDIEDIPKIDNFYWNIRYDKRNPKHYIETHNKGKRIHLHRFLLGLTEFKKNVCVDHINGDSLDNRKNNLRLCTHKENMQNMRPRQKAKRNNLSGILGIFWVKKHNRWRVVWQGKYLGQFPSLKEAKAKLDEYLLNNRENHDNNMNTGIKKAQNT